MARFRPTFPQPAKTRAGLARAIAVACILATLATASATHRAPAKIGLITATELNVRNGPSRKWLIAGFAGAAAVIAIKWHAFLAFLDLWPLLLVATVLMLIWRFLLARFGRNTAARTVINVLAIGMVSYTMALAASCV